ncbi:hypothetical protein CPB83DRAFT_840680 [Crepidotus variabilis]|uniref:Uncharacterized protein n=1 Tax=Crepidotus variabilis TaxID=179855 RepID=A0A9P6E425_9AGAR|nr:hypothetical protein CPB83DRAFT_840680 [Crepidotus variabilis]
MTSDEQLLFVRYNIQFASIVTLLKLYSITIIRLHGREKLNTFGFENRLSPPCFTFVADMPWPPTLSMFWLSRALSRSCDGAYRLAASLGLVGRIGILTVWGARTYAVFNKHRGVLAFVAALGVSRLLFCIIHVPFVSCVKRPKAFLGIPSELLAIMTMVDEMILAALSTYKIHQNMASTPKMDGTAQFTTKSIMRVIMEQGLLYLFFVTLLACGTITFYNLEGVMFEPLLNAFTVPVSGMMTCRFLIHLREWEDSRSGGDLDQESIDFAVEPIHFRDAPPDQETTLSWSEHLQRDPLLNFRANTPSSESEEPIGSDRV